MNYDAEFPLVARAMAEAGAEVLLVPACTDSQRGYWRVRAAAMARALENQCVVVQAVTVGEADWLPAAKRSHGAAAIYGPADVGFPEDGVIAVGKADSAGWVHGEIGLEAVRQVREAGAVKPFRDWPGRAELAVETVPLGQAPAEG